MPYWCKSRLDIHGDESTLISFRNKARGWAPFPSYASPWRRAIPRHHAAANNGRMKKTEFSFGSFLPIPKSILLYGYGNAESKWCMSHWGTRGDNVDDDVIVEHLNTPESTEEALTKMIDLLIEVLPPKLSCISSSSSPNRPALIASSSQQQQQIICDSEEENIQAGSKNSVGKQKGMKNDTSSSNTDNGVGAGPGLILELIAAYAITPPKDLLRYHLTNAWRPMSQQVLIEASKPFPTLRMELRVAEIENFGVMRTVVQGGKLLERFHENAENVNKECTWTCRHQVEGCKCQANCQCMEKDQVKEEKDEGGCTCICVSDESHERFGSFEEEFGDLLRISG